MAKTSDGIDEKDWNLIRETCVRIADAVESGDEAMESIEKAELFRRLDALEKKYGECPSIFATRADFSDNEMARVVLLQKAFDIAMTNSDFKNLTLISSSLAQLYIEDLKDVREGKKWLGHLKLSLKNHWDSGEADELERLSKLV